MITLKSDGGLGNQLNYFLTGYHLYQLTGLKFEPKRINGFINTYNSIGDIENHSQVLTSSFYSYRKLFFEKLKESYRGIIVDNMIHRYEVFKQIGQGNVKNYLAIDNENLYEKANENDLIIHIRLGDYRWAGGGAIADKNLYLNVINSETFNNCIIITDDPNDSYLDDFKRIGCQIRSRSPLEDFCYLKSAKKICISKSTFSWTAAYISEADKIYFPLSDNRWPYFANPGPDDADMRPTDLSNWIFI